MAQCGNMRGITEEKLKAIRDSGGMHGTTMWRLTECFVEELNQWQPIESAPKDQNIWLYENDNSVGEGYYSSIWDKFVFITDKYDPINPTLWMPLPELPEPPK